jgi:GNAT superfamily N-acetyltransferase
MGGVRVYSGAMNDKVAVRIVPATPDMAPALTMLAYKSKGYWGYPLRWMARWRPQMTITPELVAEHPMYVALEESCPVGFYVLIVDGRQGILDHLWVLPEAIGRGVGRALWEHAMGELAARGVRTVELTADPNAEGFYLRMGARRVRTKRYRLEGQMRELPVLRMEIGAP